MYCNRVGERDSRIDCLKFWLIIFVVFGHITQFTFYDHEAFSVHLVRRIIRSIYLFHMPLFIMISGYFSRKKEKKSFLKDIVKLVKVYFIFHLFWIFIGIYNGRTITFERFFHPSFTLWYLHCLIIWRLFLQLIPSKLLSNTYLIMSMSLLISIFGGFIHVSNLLSLQRLFTFMPLFFLGYYAKEYGWFKKNYQLKWYYLFLPIVLIVIENIIRLDYWGRSPYDSMLDLIRRIFFLTSSVFISWGIIKLLPLNISLFSKEGKDVLFYYMYHSIVLYFIAAILQWMGIVANGYILLLVFISTMVILYFLRKIKILHIPLK